MRTAFRLLLLCLFGTAALGPVFVSGVFVGDAAAQPAWRVAAEERIEQHRKGTLRLVVHDEAGQPVPNAPVHVQMQRHAFGFGTAVTVNRIIGAGRNDTYRDKLTNLTGDGRSFNLTVFGNAFKWEPWESQWPVSTTLKTAAVAYLQSQGLDVRGHTLLWGSMSQGVPADVETSTDPTFVRDRIQSHIRSLAGRTGIKGLVREWDVLNEPVHETKYADLFKGAPGYPTGEEIYAQAFEWAAEADPEARLYINDYNIIANYNTGWQAGTRRRYREIIQGLLDAGAPLDGIGFQGHMSPASPTSPENAYRVLEEYAAFGRALAVTEYDYAYSGNNSQTCTKADEQAAANYLRDFLTVVFSHPQSESFTMWGFWDGDHWRCDAVMFREDWSLKPSGQAFLDLVFDAWWTDTTATTNADGEVFVRGVLGEYELTADVAGGPVTRTLDLTSTDTTRVVLSRSTTAAEAAPGVPAAVTLAQNYPNPFNPQTVISYGLAAPAHVRLDVFDALGRTVARLVDATRGAGWHEAIFTADTLPGGVYFYRLTAGGETRTGRMLLAK